MWQLRLPGPELRLARALERVLGKRGPRFSIEPGLGLVVGHGERSLGSKAAAPRATAGGTPRGS